ncbi:UDP-glucuronate 4-epimerase [Thermolongibacillus altinsuensis]|uniref:UDP-glucuronate 4-epimerase n=1 Tax=Thermolongibacillus altinsuensis TaxID=575256 RepID=A0A4R1QIJ6_9BACL|nr:NAD-dependent epimerase/dehydratase family protein [Thermolongibacillus altinsuensis]TCL51874.1 UDP-glucuronate 4-epimerase [Thermolongibacillus altinsuensis]GMB07408.1 epimerase [Thermolongibacillus altinsuensis]
MKILITGGAGFIGSHLAKKLLRLGHGLIIIDNFDSYYSPIRKKQQLEEVKKEGSFHFYEVNVLDLEKTMQIFADHRPEAVFHLAALPGVQRSLDDPLAYIDYDVKATVNVLKAAGESGVRHVLFASSSSVYGNRPFQPLKEEMATGQVISPYAAAKYSAESFCHAYAHLYGYALTIFRYFTVYGPWGRPDMAISKFIRRLLKDEPITVYGENTARDYTFIDDIVDGMVAALSRENGSEIFNLGAGQPVTMNELLLSLKQYFPNMKVIHERPRLGDVSATWADISKARKLLGYEPKFSLKEGLAKTIAWAKEYER